MCVAVCHRFVIFFWNHDDCAQEICPMAGAVHPPCQTCRHRRKDDTCVLTRAPLPESGCCHWNVIPVDGPLRVTPAMVAPLAGFFDTVKHILADLPHCVVADQWQIPIDHIQTLDELGIPYQASDEGLLVDPTQSILVIDEPVTDIFDRLDTPYQVDPDTGSIWVEPTDLSLPQIYGRGFLE